MKRISTFFLFVLLFSASLFAQIEATRTASVTGDWDQTATWGGSSVPTSADVVTINPGITVTIPTSYTATSRTVDNQGTLVMAGTGELIITPSTGETAFTNSGIFTAGASTRVEINMVNASSAFLSNATSLSFTTLHIHKPSGSGTFTFLGAGSITATSEMQLYSPIVYNMGGKTYTIATLRFDNSSAQTANFTGSSISLGNFATVGAAGTTGNLNLTSATLTFTGSLLDPAQTGGVPWTINGTNTNLVLAGSGAQTTNFGNGLNNPFFNNITVSNGTSWALTAAAPTQTVTVNGTFSTNANISVTNVIFAYGAGASLTYTGGINITQGGEWPAVNGPTNVTVNMNSTFSVTMSATRTMTGTLTVNSGSTLGLSTFTLNLTTAAGHLVNNGTITSSTGVLVFDAAGHNISGTGTLASTTVSAGSTVVITGGTQTVSGGTFTMNANMTATGNLTIGATGFFVGAAAVTLSGGGTFTTLTTATFTTAHVGGVNGTLTNTAKVLSGTGTYVFNGGAAQVTGALLPGTIGNLTINNSSGTGVTLSQSLVVTGTTTLTLGQLIIAANTLTLGVAGVGNANGTGGLSITGGSFTGGGSADFVYNVPISFTLNVLNGLNNLTNDGGPGVVVTLAAATTIAGQVKVNSGAIDPGPITSFGGSLTIGVNASALKNGVMTLTNPLTVNGVTTVHNGVIHTTGFNFISTGLATFGNTANSTDGFFDNVGAGATTFSAGLTINRGVVDLGINAATITGTVSIGGINGNGTLILSGPTAVNTASFTVGTNGHLHTFFNVMTITGTGAGVNAFVFNGTRFDPVTDAAIVFATQTPTGQYSLSGSGNAGNITLNTSSVVVFDAVTTGTFTLNNLTVLDGRFNQSVGSTLNINGNLDIAASATAIFGAALTSTVNIKGNWTRGAGGVWDPQTSTVVFNGTIAQAILPVDEDFYNLTLNNTTPANITFVLGTAHVNPTNNLTITSAQPTQGSALDLAGNLTIGTNGTLATLNFNINLEGSWTNASQANFIEGTSIVTFDGTTNQNINTTGGETFYGLIISDNAGTVTMLSNVQVMNALTLAISPNGALVVGANTLELNGTVTNNALTTGSTSNLNLLASFSTPTLPAFPSFELATFWETANASISLGSNLIVHNLFDMNTFTVNTFNLNGFNFTINGNVILGASDVIGGHATSNLTINGTGTNPNGFTLQGTTVLNSLFVNRDNHIVTTGAGLLTLNTGLVILAGTVTLGANLDVNGFIANGDTLNGNGKDINISGDWGSPGGYFAHGGAGTVTFDGIALQTILGTYTFYNLSLNNTLANPATALMVAGTTTIANNLTITDGRLTVGANITLLGNLNIASNANADLDGGGYNFIIYGSWTRGALGSFIPGTGTVTFEGTSSVTITEQSFYDLNINNPNVTDFTYGPASSVFASHTLSMNADVLITLASVGTMTGNLSVNGGTFQMANPSADGNVDLTVVNVNIVAPGVINGGVAGSRLNLSGNWSNTGTTANFVENVGHVNFINAGSKTTSAETYNDLTVTTADVTMLGNVTVMGALTLSGQLIIGANILTLEGSLPSNPITGGITSSLVITGAGGSGNLVGPITLLNLTINRNTFTVSIVTAALTIAANGTLNMNNGTLASGGFNINLGNGSIVTYSGSGDVTGSPSLVYAAGQVDFVFNRTITTTDANFPVTAIGDLTLQSGNVTLHANRTVQGLATLTAGSFILNGVGFSFEGDVVQTSGVFSTPGSGGIAFAGSTLQTWALGGNRVIANSFFLTLNKTVIDTVLITGGNLTIFHVIFGAGKGVADLGSNLLTLTGGFSGSPDDDSHIKSALQMNVPAGLPVTFPVGDGTDYSPASLASVGTSAGLTTVKFVNSDPAGNLGLPESVSGTNVAEHAGFYWSVTPTNPLSVSDLAVTLTNDGFTHGTTAFNEIRTIYRTATGPGNWDGINGTYANADPNVVVSSGTAVIPASEQQFTFGLKSVVFDITGFVYYGNDQDGTPGEKKVPGVTLTRTPDGVATALTDVNGDFTFSNVTGSIGGTAYTLAATLFPAWPGGSYVNSTDAVAVVNHIIGNVLIPGAALRFTAANVDTLNSIDVVDALQILQRSASIISSFAAGDWYQVPLSTTLFATNLTAQVVRVIAFGDVNESFSSTLPSKIVLNLANTVKVRPDKPFEVPVMISNDASIAGFTMNFTYPERMVEYVGYKSKVEGMMVVAENGVLKVAWLDISGKNAVHVKDGEEIITFQFKPTTGFTRGSRFTLSLDNDFTSFSNANAELLNLGLSSVNIEAAVPTEFAMQQNYPNPFNPSTKLEYQIPENARVKLTIFNAIGEEMVTLVNTQQDAGWYTVDWNAKNLASGMYIYRLDVQGVDKSYSKVLKMMLLK